MDEVTLRRATFPQSLPTKTRAIAMYLPQFHPIPENDEWWGPGFTEWTNTAKARPLYRGHYQPHVPADLGFYDLRLPEAREAQASMARDYGIEAFCYYHYWFAGRRLLERPFQEVLSSGKPDFPFCLCWANQTWTGVWHGAADRVLVEQTYPGEDDHRRHFEELLPAFLDPRYLRVDGKPVFIVLRAHELPSTRHTLDLWRELSRRAGLPDLYLIGQEEEAAFDPRAFGYDATVSMRVRVGLRESLRGGKLAKAALRRIAGGPTVIPYRDAVKTLVAAPRDGVTTHPCVIPNWDNTPRSGVRGLVYEGSTPEDFRAHLRQAIDRASQEPESRRLLFIKSWNEWAEGNHLEPDVKWGRAYLQVVKEELMLREPESVQPISIHDGPESVLKGQPRSDQDAEERVAS